MENTDRVPSHAKSYDNTSCAILKCHPRWSQKLVCADPEKKNSKKMTISKNVFCFNWKHRTCVEWGGPGDWLKLNILFEHNYNGYKLDKTSFSVQERDASTGKLQTQDCTIASLRSVSLFLYMNFILFVIKVMIRASYDLRNVLFNRLVLVQSLS